MDLKETNSNSVIVLESILNHADFFLIIKIAFTNESYKLFFQEDVLIAPKQDCT